MSALADISAWVWSRRSGSAELRQVFDRDLVDGLLATCDVVKLELLYSARNHDALVEMREGLDSMPACPIGPAETGRAVEVYEALAARGGVRHRAVSHRALLVAAAAESAGVPVLHHDPAFERIAAVTRQRLRRL